LSEAVALAAPDGHGMLSESGQKSLPVPAKKIAAFALDKERVIC
jgi:hypothetical protein